MDSVVRGGLWWQLFVVFSILCFQSTAEDGSLFLIDSPTHRYLRSPSPNSQINLISAMEVGAAVSVLLGLQPPPMLSTASSSKLNEFLLPNPFDRPRHVFLLEVGLAEDSQELVFPDSGVFTNAIKSKLIRDAGKVEIELPGTEEVASFSLDGPDYNSYLPVTDEELNDFASSFGGLYKSENLESINGELIIPLPSGVKLSLDMSKKADRKFATSMIHLINNIRKVTTKDLAQSSSNFAQLAGGFFEGIKVLQEEYKSNDIAQQAMELLFNTVTKALDSLQEKYDGKMVAVIIFSKVPQRMVDVTYVSRPSSRFLEEVKSSSNSTAEAEVALVRRTLAWFTGIVLIIATLIGVYMLMYMPLTRDTLLYSNVKLD